MAGSRQPPEAHSQRFALGATAKVGLMALLGGALLVPARGDLIVPTTGGQALVRVNNPSDVPVTGAINGQDYTIGAHQTIEEMVEASRIVIVPGNDSMGNPYPDPVVDVETGRNGFIASPPLYTPDDLTYKGQLFGLGTGASLLPVPGNQASRIAVYALSPDGALDHVLFKDLNADSPVLFTPAQLFGELPAGTTIGVEYVSGSGQAVLVTGSSVGDERYQRMVPVSGTLLGRLYVDKWVKPASKPLKLDTVDATNALRLFSREIAAYALQDPTYTAAFDGDVDACAAWLNGLVDGDLSNGELQGNNAFKEKNDVLYLKLNKKDAEKNNLVYPVPVTPVQGTQIMKAAINAPNGRAFLTTILLPLLAKTNGYNGDFNVSPKNSGALWAHN